MRITGSIVTYNNESLIEGTITNILSRFSKFPEFHLFVVDNNSTDRTKQLLKKFSEIEVIELKDNIGFGSAHNVAINLISHDGFHLIINPDIMIPEESQFENVIRYFATYPNVGLVSPKILNTDGTIQYLPKAKPTFFRAMNRFILKDTNNKMNQKYLKKDMDFNKDFPIEYVSGSFMIFRSNILKSINGFDERYFLHFEDADITQKTLKVAEVYYFPDYQVIHGWARDNRKSFKVFKIALVSMAKYFLKWGLW